MLLSLALIFILGILLGGIFEKFRLPRLLGMLLVGILLGPYALNLLDSSILSVSADLRKIALIIILTRAGLNLDLNELKQVGRAAILLCFLPALFEIGATVLIAPKLLGLSYLESAVLGTVIAAVSPAVIVPKMLKLMSENYGTNKSIPQMIMAGASVDDVFVIVLFTAFTSLASGENISYLSFIKIPVSIITGLAFGGILGVLLGELFKKIHIRDTVKVIIILSISFILVSIENTLDKFIGFSGLLAIMAIGIALNKRSEKTTKRLSVKYSKLWVGSEVILFVLVGSTVNIKYALNLGFLSAVIIFVVLIFRLLGVFVCMIKTNLSFKEKLFCMIAYSPKATVQAAIGSIPLTMGLACGDTVLCIAVTAILVTAPLGAFLIDLTYKKFLCKN